MNSEDELGLSPREVSAMHSAPEHAWIKFEDKRLFEGCASFYAPEGGGVGRRVGRVQIETGRD